MKRYILTGAPGAGKTTILRALEAMGCAVVEEAATDVNGAMMAKGIAEPWRTAPFIDNIVELQQRREAAAVGDEHAFFDRSPVCTLALERYLERPPSEALAREIDRIGREGVYDRRVFFIDNLGFIENTPIRRISFEDTLRFEAVHEAVYRELGYELVRVPPAEPARRAELILRCIGEPR
jgi:predicted ATPase